MHYLQAAGLALAGSIGGWVLFYFTIKEIGFDKLKEILKDRYLIYYIVGMAVFAGLMYEANIYLVDWIRT